LLILLMAGCSERDRPLDSPVTLQGEIFGTFYQVTIADTLTQREANALEEGVQAELEAVDAAMSTWREDSELMAFNEAPLGEWQPLSDELIEVLAIGQAVADASDGAFDMTIGGLVNLWSFGPEARPREVPSAASLSARLAETGPDSLEVDEQARRARRLRDVFVDLSGVAKGHATDRVAAYLAHLAATGRSAGTVTLDGEDAAAVLNQAAGANLETHPESTVDLLASDLGMARVVEDLFEALKTKGVLAEADLPAEARDRIAGRRTLRGGQS